jgi:hypothetical protein
MTVECAKFKRLEFLFINVTIVGVLEMHESFHNLLDIYPLFFYLHVDRLYVDINRYADA